MVEGIAKAVALALSYVEGLRSGDPGLVEQAPAFLEHLAGQGYVGRPRGGARVRLRPGSLEGRHTSVADIRAMRVALDLSLGQPATRTGIHQETLARVESGRTRPQSRTVAAILDALAAVRTGAAHQGGATSHLATG